MKETILIICIGLLSFSIQGQKLISKWSFDKNENPLVSEKDQLLGFYDSVSGIKGNAIWLDGYTSYIKKDKFG